jgi:TonB family protein
MTILGVRAHQPTERPEVVAAVAPTYPLVAVAVNAGGEVLVDIEIDGAGRVIAARGVSGHPLLRRAAESTAQRWLFKPADGRRNALLTFAFRIMPRDATLNDLTPIFTPPYKVEVRSLPREPIIHSDPPAYVRPTRQSLRRRG